MPWASAIRRADLDPTVPIPEGQSLEQALAQSIATRRARALPAIGFGGLALTVAFVGVLATLMTLVAERQASALSSFLYGVSPVDATTFAGSGC